MAILDTDLLLVNRPGDDETYKYTFGNLKDELPPGTIVSEDPPTTDLQQGLLWFDSSIASLFIWYDDGDTAQWVDVYAGRVPESGGANVIVSENPPTQRTDGEALEEGDLWWNNDTEENGGGRMYVYYDSAWVDTSLPGGGGGGGASVSVGESAPSGPSEGDLWWNSTDIDDGGGRMYIYYGGQWIDASILGGGGGGVSIKNDGTEVATGVTSINFVGSAVTATATGTDATVTITSSGSGGGLSQDDANLLYLSKTGDDTAAGEITFQGTTTHAGGVSVTGGDATTSPGIYRTGSNFNIASDPNNADLINFIQGGKVSCAINTLGRFDSRLQNKPDTGNLIGFQTTGTIDGDATSVIESIQSYRADGSITNQLGDTGYPNARIQGVGFYATNDYGTSSFSDASRSANRLLTYSGFKVQGIADGALTSYGFYSDVQTTSNTTQYNFYAAGNAPNYFAGNIETAGRIRAYGGSNYFGTSTRFGNESVTDVGNGNQEIGVGIVGSSGSVHASNNNGPALNTNRNNSGSAISLRRQGIEVGTIDVQSNGVVLPPPASDYRLKENVSSFAVGSATEKVNQLNPTLFSFKSDEQSEIIQGFIAHEVAEVVPYAVKGEKDEVDEAGNPVYQGVWSERLIPLLTKALQEALTEIDTLKTRLNDAGIA